MHSCSVHIRINRISSALNHFCQRSNQLHRLLFCPCWLQFCSQSSTRHALLRIKNRRKRLHILYQDEWNVTGRWMYTKCNHLRTAYTRTINLLASIYGWALFVKFQFHLFKFYLFITLFLYLFSVMCIQFAKNVSLWSKVKYTIPLYDYIIVNISSQYILKILKNW